MIEGLRLLAWFQKALRENPKTYLANCRTCMQTVTRENRMLVGCGYEPAVPQARAWAPPVATLGYQGPRPKVCAGFTTRLPQVIEVARAHTHWKNGALAHFCGGPPSDHMLGCLEILDGEASAMEVYSITSKKNGGGRDDG